LKNSTPLLPFKSRDGSGGWAGRGRVSLSHTHLGKKNPSPSLFPNLTGIKLLSHLHPHRVTGIISTHTRTRFLITSILILINFYKTIKNYGKENIILSNIGEWLFL